MTASRRQQLEAQAPGPYLRYRRKTYGLTLADVSAVCGYSTTYLSKIERGVLDAPNATIVRISRAIELRSCGPIPTRSSPRQLSRTA